MFFCKFRSGNKQKQRILVHHIDIELQQPALQVVVCEYIEIQLVEQKIKRTVARCDIIAVLLRLGIKRLVDTQRKPQT
jgi:hypothetical protein